MKFLFSILIFFNFSFLNLIANEQSGVIDLSKSEWEYKWGDSPFENSIPIWVNKENGSIKWEKINYPKNPPQRNNQTNIWFRVKIPDNLPLNPYLYIFSTDLINEVYYQDKKIYGFGNFDIEGKGTFAGWPWHFIQVPSNSSGEYLYFRIYSNYIDIGLWGEILISSKAYIYEKRLKDDIPKIMVGAISIFVAIFFLLSFLSKYRKIEFLILGLLFLTQGFNVFFSAKIIDIYFFHPLLTQYILAFAFLSFPIGMAMYMDKVINIKVPFNLIKRIWQIHLTYIIASILGIIFGFIDLTNVYVYFDIFYNFISLPILTFFMIYFFLKGNKEIKIITFSFFIISIYWLYSTLIAHELVPWEEYPSDLAVFLCLLILAHSLIYKLNYTQELEKSNDELTVSSSTDYLTNLYNRKEIDTLLKKAINLNKRYKDNFSIILLDIDNFKETNDKYGHLVGDQVLISFANILVGFTREVDLIGRWGGEEFIIICPNTKKDEALILAEKLRATIEKYKFNDIGHKTASFGVVSYGEDESLNELLLRVDKALYSSKSKGRNKVTAN